MERRGVQAKIKNGRRNKEAIKMGKDGKMLLKNRRQTIFYLILPTRG